MISIDEKEWNIACKIQQLLDGNLSTKEQYRIESSLARFDLWNASPIVHQLFRLMPPPVYYRSDIANYDTQAVSLRMQLIHLIRKGNRRAASIYSIIND